MTPYATRILPSAIRDLRRIPKDVKRNIGEHIDGLAENPRPSGSVRLRGGDGHWRIRVGVYRIIYRIDDEQRAVLVSRIGHRREIYRRL